MSVIDCQALGSLSSPAQSDYGDRAIHPLALFSCQFIRTHGKCSLRSIGLLTFHPVMSSKTRSIQLTFSEGLTSQVFEMQTLA